MLRAAATIEVGALLTALDEAVHSGMIEELRSVKLAYRFTHELVRRALYDALTAARRAELHLRVGEALERAGGAPAADLAHHFTVAAPLAGAERGVAYNVAAARAAAAALAYDEADERLSVALSLGVEDPAQRAPLLIELGTIRNRAGRAVDALQAYAEAATLAPDAELLAQAAIGYEETCWRPAIKDPLAVELLDARGRGARPSSPRGCASACWAASDARCRWAASRSAAPPSATRRSRWRACSATARRSAACSPGSYWSRGTSSPEQVLELLTEARDLATELGDVDLQTEAMLWRVPALLVRLRPRDRARGGGRGARDRGAHRAAVQPARRRALRVGDRALRGPARRCRGAGAALARVEPAADRP